MEKRNSRENILARFEAARQRKREVTDELKKELEESYEKRTGKKPTSFFVL